MKHTIHLSKLTKAYKEYDRKKTILEKNIVKNS